MTAQETRVKPAIDALADLRRIVLDRVGKEGGNLNGRMRNAFDTVGMALSQFDTVLSMNNTIAQQSQMIIKITNDLSRYLPAAQSDATGDDGSSTTKGE